MPIYVEPQSKEPADLCTWGMEAIDYIAVSDPTMVVGGVMHVLPRPANRVKVADAVDIKGRIAKESAYATPPYADGGKWPSDHWFCKIKFVHKVKPVPASVTAAGTGDVTNAVTIDNSAGASVACASHDAFVSL